jgi:hypothetical protein
MIYFNSLGELKHEIEKILQEAMVPSFLKSIFAKYPTNATSWRDADDTMRDLTRMARETYNEHNDFVEGDDGYIESMNFRSFKTPSEWNTKSQNEIVRIYNMMTPQIQKIYKDSVLRYFK